MTTTHVEAKPHRIKLLLGKVISFVALCLALFAAGILIAIPAITGSQPYTVLTNSMAPKYPPGSLMIVKPVDFGFLRPGDVVTYQLDSGKPEVVTHRIVSIGVNQEGDRTLITQGDNNSVEDELPVQEVQVRGKLLYAVPYVGWLSNWMESGNRDGLVKWLAGGFIAYGMFSIARGIRDTHRKKKAS